MALNEINEIAYLYLFEHRICQKVNYPTTRTITRKAERIDTNGVKTYIDIHERHFRTIEGMLIDIQLKERDNGRKEWHLWLQDGAEKYCLQLHYSSRESKRFLSYLPNADLNHFIKIQTFKEKESDGTALLVSQRNIWLKSAFTKDAPNGLPQMVKGFNEQGKEVWNDTEQMVFFEQLAETLNKQLHKLHGTPPRLRKTDTPTATSPAIAETANPFPAEVGADEDAPF
jgi:hypothetical protein